jgi:3D (Asp-Asp-Asp) domain-containing protein
LFILFPTYRTSIKDACIIKKQISISQHKTTSSNKNIIDRNVKTSRSSWRVIEVQVEITTYTAGYESTGKYPSDPAYGITASGKKVLPFHTIALPKEFPYGTEMIIEDDPNYQNIVFVCEDRGGAIKILNNGIVKVDMYVNSLDEAKKYGKQYHKVLLKIPIE